MVKNSTYKINIIYKMTIEDTMRLKKLIDELIQNRHKIGIEETDKQMILLKKEWVKNVKISKNDIKMYILITFATCGAYPILQRYLLSSDMKGLKTKEKFKFMIATSSNET